MEVTTKKQNRRKIVIGVLIAENRAVQKQANEEFLQQNPGRLAGILL